MTYTATITRIPNQFMDSMIARNKRVAELKASGMDVEGIAYELGLKLDVAQRIYGSDLPKVTVPTPKRRIEATDLAKLVRKALKQSFPGVKFSVRTSKYSMGSSVNVSWTDGPTNAQMNGVLDVYRDVDGTRNDDTEILRTNALDGEPVRFGPYVFGQREHSNAFIAGVKKSIAALSDAEREKFMATLTDHQKEYPYTTISLCAREESAELSRVTRLDHLPKRS